MQQPAIILILRQSNHHQHTTTTSPIIIITATITVLSTTMSIISPTLSVSSGKQHAHLLREFYGIDGDTLLNSRKVQPLFFLGNSMEHSLYLKFLQGWPMENN
jgi:hypothetical protein